MAFGDGVDAIVTSDWAFDHLGLVVKDLATGRRELASMLGISLWTEPLADTVNRVNLQFGRDLSGLVYELLEPLGSDSPIAAIARSKGPSLNHVAYRVSDLAKSRSHVEALGGRCTARPTPAIAYGGRPIQFFITPMRLLIELIEAPNHEHDFIPDKNS